MSPAVPAPDAVAPLPAGGHGAGTGLPGVAEFPGEWTAAELRQCIAAAAGEPSHATRLGPTLIGWRDFDGVRVVVVLRWHEGEAQPRFVTAFPAPDGVRIVPNPQPEPLHPLAVRAAELEAVLAEAVGGSADAAVVLAVQLGRTLLAAGEVAEAVLWFAVLAQEQSVAIPAALAEALLEPSVLAGLEASYGRPLAPLIRA